MFQMLNNGETNQKDGRKLMMLEIGVFAFIMLGVVGVIYLFAFLPYINR